MRLPVEDFDKWYSAQKFGVKTSYGYHEGEDLNLKTGGDTDLGQPLFSIAEGEVTSVHSHTGAPTFGKHVHIRHEGEWGVVWSHYAHCSEVLVKIGDKVQEGQVIAKIGKTGTKYAHCHFAIKKEPTGVDGIAKTQEDLKKWTDPTEFILEWARKTGGNMDWLIEYFRTQFQIDLTKNEGDVRGQLQKLVDALSRFESAEAKVSKLEKELEGKAAESATWEERYSQTFRRGEELEEQIAEKNRAIKDRDETIYQLTTKLQGFEGKIAITEEEYERLNSKECLNRFKKWELFLQLFKRR